MTVKEVKVCGNCATRTICKLSEALWDCYRKTLQGRVKNSPDCVIRMEEVLSAHCDHWQEYR